MREVVGGGGGAWAEVMSLHGFAYQTAPLQSIVMVSMMQQDFDLKQSFSFLNVLLLLFL